MRLGYNTNGLQNHRLADGLRLLADHGYQAVAITPDIQHLDPYTCTPQEVEAIAGLLDELGLHPTMETGARFVLDPVSKHEPTLMTRDPAARARRIDYLTRVARIGRDLGAEVVSFFAGIDRGPAADSRATLQQGVAEACAAIRDQGLVPALEPEPGMAVATVADYLELAAALGPDGPRLCLDIGHLYVTGEGSPGAVIPPVADRLVQVHLEDMRTGVHEHLLPGEGDVDFAAVRRVLEGVNYAGPVCFELSRSSHLAPVALRLCWKAWNARHR